jgi:hypothetical protein
MKLIFLLRPETNKIIKPKIINVKDIKYGRMYLHKLVDDFFNSISGEQE